MDKNVTVNKKSTSIFDRKIYPISFEKIILITLCLVLLCVALNNRFIQDDAFISFRYASNLADGYGLVWNADEAPVEGYTNFLWTIIMVIPFIMDIEPIVFSQLFGLLCFLGTLIFTYKICRYFLASPLFASIVVLTLGLNYTFSSYATGGLETQLQAFLIVASSFLILSVTEEKKYKVKLLLAISLIWSMAILTRLDSVLFIVIMCLYLGWRMIRERVISKTKIWPIISLILPCALIIGVWFVWKLQYYGSILPNTYFIKIGSSIPIRLGIEYLGHFLTSYWLMPFCFLILCFSKNIIHRTPAFLLILSAIGLWCLYIVRVGGDFMEFRFLVPILPFVFIFIVYSIHLLKRTEIQIAMLSMLLLGSWWHDSTFIRRLGTESIRGLQLHLYGEDQAWIEIGKILGQYFSDDDVCIATTAAGAIPFYSNLKTIDMLGLNDRWIAKHGKIKGNRPGHQKFATHDYLYNCKVNLVLGHPQMIPKTRILKTSFTINDLLRFNLIDIKAELIPDNSKVIEIPINERYNIIIYYFIQHPDVDRIIQDNEWRCYPVEK